MVLPAPVRPTSATVCAGLDVEVDVGEHRLARLVGERDVLVADGPLYPRHILRIGSVEEVGLRVEEVEDAGSGGHRPLQLRELLREAADGVEEALDVERELDELTHPKRAAENEPTAENDGRRQAKGHEHLDRRHQGRGEALRAEVRVEVPLVELLERHEVLLLAAHALDDADPVEVFGQRRVDVGDCDAHTEERGSGVRLPHVDDQDQHGQRRKREQREFPVRYDHDREDTAQAQQVGDAQHDDVQELLQLIDVVLRA